MKRLWPILLLFIGCQSKSSIIESGVSWELAQQRKASISDVRYKLSFDIPKDKDDFIKAEGSINFKLSDLTNDVVLDFRLSIVVCSHTLRCVLESINIRISLQRLPNKI